MRHYRTERRPLITRIGSILLTLATLSILTLGFYMPNIFMINNGGHTSVSQQYAVETVQLKAASKTIPVIDALKLVSGKYKEVNLESGNMLNAEEAYRSALETLEFIMENDILPDLEMYTSYKEKPVTFYSNYPDMKRYIAHKEMPNMIYTEDGENATVVWSCEFSNPVIGSSILLLLDDESGKMLSFLYTSPTDSEDQDGTFEDSFSADSWAKMCMRYYDFQSAEVLTVLQDNVDEQYEITFKSDDGKNLTLPYYTDNLTNTTSSIKPSFPNDTRQKVVCFNMSTFS